MTYLILNIKEKYSFVSLEIILNEKNNNIWYAKIYLRHYLINKQKNKFKIYSNFY
jgi:hypothetical protein